MLIIYQVRRSHSHKLDLIAAGQLLMMMLYGLRSVNGSRLGIMFVKITQDKPSDTFRYETIPER